MARRKVKLAYIVDKSKRNASYQKRKNGLLKKTDELSTLCGVEACAVIYKEDNPQPEVWPSESKAQSTLTKFLSMPEFAQHKNKVDQERYLRQMIQKTEMKQKKQRDDNKKLEMINLLHQSLLSGRVDGNVNMSDLNGLSSLIDAKLKDVQQRLNWLQSQEVLQNMEALTLTNRGEPSNVVGVQGVAVGRDETTMGNAMVTREQEQANLSQAQGTIDGGEIQDFLQIEQQLQHGFHKL